jgi:hypothetical protein
MKRLALAAALLACMPAGAADRWSPRDIALEAAYQAVNLVDAATTADIRNHDDVQEAGPLASAVLGSQPDPLETAAYFAVLGAAHAAVTHALPSRYRPWWQAVTITTSAAYAGNNLSLGLRWGFR